MLHKVCGAASKQSQPSGQGPIALTADNHLAYSIHMLCCAISDARLVYTLSLIASYHRHQIPEHLFITGHLCIPSGQAVESCEQFTLCVTIKAESAAEQAAEWLQAAEEGAGPGKQPLPVP